MALQRLVGQGRVELDKLTGEESSRITSGSRGWLVNQGTVVVIHTTEMGQGLEPTLVPQANQLCWEAIALRAPLMDNPVLAVPCDLSRSCYLQFTGRLTGWSSNIPTEF